VISVRSTGFIVGEPPYLVTAKHVFEEKLHTESNKFGVLTGPPSDNLTVNTLEDIQASPEHDIAAVSAQELPWVHPLSISNQPVPNNQDVLAYEFSSTRIETLATGQRQVLFTPFTHKGNVLRHYTSTFPDRYPTPSFDTSFPALQGASGAPVVRAHDFAVVGMLVANHERHLLPAQVVRLETDERTVEETKYFLPVGKAIEAHFVIEALDRLGISVTPIA
jgi:Trypsin-like peptidase domain